MKIQRELFSEQTGRILKLLVSFVSLTMLTLHKNSLILSHCCLPYSFQQKLISDETV